MPEIIVIANNGHDGQWTAVGVPPLGKTKKKWIPVFVMMYAHKLERAL